MFFHNTKREYRLASTIGCIAVFLCTAPVVYAQSTSGVGGSSLTQVGTAAGLAGGSDLYTLIGRVIYVFLSLIGVVLLGILLFAGYQWMTSDGEKGALEARTRIRNAVIGLVIIAMAYAITAWIMSMIGGAILGLGGSGSGGVGDFSGFFPSRAGSLGSGIIEYHYPERDATNIPRNTSVVISFKEPIRVSSLVQGYTSSTVGPYLLNTDVLKIFPTGHTEEAYTASQVHVSFTGDHKNFVFRLNGMYFGNPTSTSDYTVDIAGGSAGLLRDADGAPAFQGSFSSGYTWRFNVSTVLDLTPPKVVSVIPVAGGRYAPNMLVQINFDKPVDPTSASGVYTSTGGFDNIRVDASPLSDVSSTHQVTGEWKIANHFYTVEFVTDSACGVNSCGDTIYCLPTDASVNVLAHAAHLSDTPPQAAIVTSGSSSLFDGVVDLSGNSLDGNGDGRAEGPDIDNAGWAFGTSHSPELVSPVVFSTTPPAGDAAGSSGRPLDDKPQAAFGGDTQAGVLEASTVNTDNVKLHSNEPASLADTFWFSVSMQSLDATGHPTVGLDSVTDHSSLMVDHRAYVSATSSTTWTPEYDPAIASKIHNIYQNCFQPAASRTCAATSADPSCCDDSPDSGLCDYPRPTTSSP